MTTKFFPNPSSLANNSPPSNSNDRTGLCIVVSNLSFRSPKLFSWNKSPPKINLLLSRDRFPQLVRPAQNSHVRDDDNSPSSCSANDDDAHDHRYSSFLKEEEEEEEEDEEARQAVSEILQEFGASKEDSMDIVLRSPKYLAMLIDSVRDLDELSLWNSWTRRRRKNEQGNGEEEEEAKDPPLPTPLSLKEKVYYMAKEKGDKGMLPFLESLGMGLPSATHLARYLSSETLPNLIHKVKYMKEMFFSNSDDEGHIGKKARQMMIHLSISIDEDVQQTLSFFEKIEARRGGLDMLGSEDPTFRYLLESFPRLLLLSLESHMKPMMEFLEDIGVPRGCTRNILMLFPPIIFYDIEKDIKLRIQAFEKLGAGNKDIGRMLLKYPWILSRGIQKNYGDIISFFDIEKVPKTSVDLAIKSWPLLLGCSISKLKVMVEQFSELGVGTKKLGQVMATSPQLLLRKPQEIRQSNKKCTRFKTKTLENPHSTDDGESVSWSYCFCFFRAI